MKEEGRAREYFSTCIILTYDRAPLVSCQSAEPVAAVHYRVVCQGWVGQHKVLLGVYQSLYQAEIRLHQYACHLFRRPSCSL